MEDYSIKIYIYDMFDLTEVYKSFIILSGPDHIVIHSFLWFAFLRPCKSHDVITVNTLF